MSDLLPKMQQRLDQFRNKQKPKEDQEATKPKELSKYQQDELELFNKEVEANKKRTR